MKKILTIFSLLLLLVSCDKNTERKVTYEVSGAVSEYSLSYLDEHGEVITTKIIPESLEDIWRYSFMAEDGDVVYVSGRYLDVNSALRISIKVDGKVYKEGYSVGDTVKFLTVSGVIPYR
jgi:hypothetical protein